MSPIAVESTAAHPTEITVGVLGAGNVGAALIGLIAEHGDAIEARTGIRLRVGRVAVRSMSREPVDTDPAQRHQGALAAITRTSSVAAASDPAALRCPASELRARLRT